MPNLNMMKDMDVSDPWARDLEKSLNKPAERIIPVPDCLKRLEEKRKAEERFEKMVDTVYDKAVVSPVEWTLKKQEDVYKSVYAEVRQEMLETDAFGMAKRAPPWALTREEVAKKQALKQERGLTANNLLGADYTQFEKKIYNYLTQAENASKHRPDLIIMDDIEQDEAQIKPQRPWMTNSYLADLIAQDKRTRQAMFFGDFLSQGD